MSVIYKYPIKIKEDEMNSFYVELPIGAEVISILCEETYNIFIYAIVNPKEEKVIKKDIVWLGTGWEIDKNIEDKIRYYTFLGTYKTKNNLVWHFWIEPDLEEYQCIDFDTGETYSSFYYKRK